MLATQGFGTGGNIATYGYSAPELLRIIRELICGLSLLRSGSVLGNSKIVTQVILDSIIHAGIEGDSRPTMSICQDSLLILEDSDELQYPGESL